MSKERCIMPNMPYCPDCKYGNISYKDEDYDGYEPPTSCKWNCLLPDTRPMEEIKKDLVNQIYRLHGNTITTITVKRYIDEAVRTHNVEMDLLKGKLEAEIYELENKLKKYEQLEDDCR